MHVNGVLCHSRAAAAAQAMVGSGEALVLHILLCCLCGGVANIRCSGHVWIEPAPVVRMGSNISINCLSTLGCSWAKFLILLNYSLTEGPLRPLNSSAVQLQLRDFWMPFGTVTCLAQCPNSEQRQLVCGTHILAGYPPDPPKNLTCTIREHSGCLVCTWDAGRPTHLSTHYTLHLRSMGTVAVEDAEEEDVFPAGLPVPLSALHSGSHYLAWVQASNALGVARSAPRRLDLQELVVPALPLVAGAETTETSPPTTTIHWRRQTLLENVRCEERHKATGAPAWHVEAWDGAAQHGPHLRHDLQSNTQYVFQVRCRLSPVDSPWSTWSTPFLYTTPEAAPAVAPDVWRRLGPVFPNGSHEVTVLIKPLPPRDARGRILGYTVATESPGGVLLLCNTSSTVCSVLVPPGARTLHVTAHNSRGSSSPASITLSQGTSSQEEFPAPVAIEVKPENQSRVSVAWQPPHRSRRSPLWFIVEWVSTTHYSQEEQYFWKKVPYHETHTYIQVEAAAGGGIDVSVYAVYPNGVSKRSSGQVPAEDQLLGSTYSEISHDDDIEVFLGLGVSMVVLSVVFVILMFKKSARKRINATVVSLLPKWLFEDFPHMENSNVVKSLQEKSDFMSNSFHEPFLDTSDPTVMEIEEVPVHKEYKNMATRRKPSREVPEDGERLGSTAPASIMTPEQISDYKPQVSDGNPPGYVAANIYQTQPPTPLPEPEMNIFFRDYTSPVSHLWDGEGRGHHVCLLEKINLILNNSRSGQSHAFGSFQGGHGSLLENQWGHMLASEVQEQTLVPDELVSCLRAMNGESVDIKTCFPQNIGRLF
ncbi:PREDICTED: interleukin-23 receptor [Aptenodytes forsteri]|uniref:interleukin-23 receptor n=1 Tax=Aptenodytes forsteri TaxID=9233 RepID=UPI0009046AE3|nr:PREDICTED: interleukin-23 receptor [Aptenodytes forsteri]